MTTETKLDDIGRIAGRMVHRAHDAGEFLKKMEAQIAILTMRLGGNDSGREEKLENLREGKARLTVAMADYSRAEKMLRVFPALLWAAAAGLKKLDEMLARSWGGSEQELEDIEKIADLIRRAVKAGEEIK